MCATHGVPVCLSIIMIWLVTRTIPNLLWNCQTVLIPKFTNVGRLGDINNWIPITIASVVFRLFSRIVTARLTWVCPVNPRQRGFILALGCYENLKLLQPVVKHAKKEHCELGVAFVDIAKAFDTICHQHIIMGLVQRRVDPPIIHLVSKIYKNIITYIDTIREKTDPIEILTGVKQGDPMSPVLFNLTLDPLLCKLETEGQGFQ